MASFDSSFDSMSVLHDITTQAASGTRSSDLACNVEDANERRFTMTDSDYDDDEYSSFCSSGSLSASTSLTSLSSSSSSEGIPTRPSSSQGWNFDGAWDVGELNHTPKPRSLAPHDVYLNDVHADPAERGLTDSPFLIAQYVARQLRAGIEEDFIPWSPDPQTPPQTPRISTPPLKGPPTRQYTNLLKALELNSPCISAMKLPGTPSNPSFRSMVSPLPSLPTIMITAPSTEQATPMICNGNIGDAIDFLTLQYLPRIYASPEQRHSTSLGWVARESDEGSDGGGYYDEDDEDLVLSHVKKTLQAARRPNIGLKGRVVDFFKMRR